MPKPSNSGARALTLDEVDDAATELLAFLAALDYANFDRQIPAAVPSELPVGDTND